MYTLRLNYSRIKSSPLLNFILMFEFTLIYLLYVLHVLKVEKNFEKWKKKILKESKDAIFLVYSINEM